jgi:hypothetical protein
MKTKKCKVVIIPVKDRNVTNYNKYPIIFRSDTSHNYLFPQEFQMNIYLQLPMVMSFAHLEFRDEDDNLLASSVGHKYNNPIVYGPYIPQSFIDKFIKANGQIKEVLIEVKFIPGCTMMDSGYNPILTPDGCVIIHPVETKINIDDIPIDAIKGLLFDIDDKMSRRYKLIERWIESLPL